MVGWLGKLLLSPIRRNQSLDKLRDWDDIERHWLRNLCNGTKKPTGSRGGNDDCINTCIAIKRLIMDKMYAGMLGISLEDCNNENSSDHSAEEDEDVEENVAVEENTV